MFLLFFLQNSIEFTTRYKVEFLIISDKLSSFRKSTTPRGNYYFVFVKTESHQIKYRELYIFTTICHIEMKTNALLSHIQNDEKCAHNNDDFY